MSQLNKTLGKCVPLAVALGDGDAQTSRQLLGESTVGRARDELHLHAPTTVAPTRRDDHGRTDTAVLRSNRGRG